MYRDAISVFNALPESAMRSIHDDKVAGFWFDRLFVEACFYQKGRPIGELLESMKARGIRP